MTIKRASQRLPRDTCGTVLILFAVALSMLIGIVGLGVEAGLWFAIKRQNQTAADIAAISGRSNSMLGKARASQQVPSIPIFVRWQKVMPQKRNSAVEEMRDRTLGPPLWSGASLRIPRPNGILSRVSAGFSVLVDGEAVVSAAADRLVPRLPRIGMPIYACSKSLAGDPGARKSTGMSAWGDT